MPDYTVVKGMKHWLTNNKKFKDNNDDYQGWEKATFTIKSSGIETDGKNVMANTESMGGIHYLKCSATLLKNMVKKPKLT